MLEVTILKVKHSGHDEARKLLPYLKNCDIYCVEGAALTEKGAEENEKEWEMTLSSKPNRNKFRQNLASCLKTILKGEEYEYAIKEYEYAYLANLPTFHLERHSQEEANRINALDKESDILGGQSLRYLMAKKIDEFLQIHFKDLEMKVEAVKIRDRNMAANLESAEQILRSRYNGRLKDKDTIRLVAGVGSIHAPEKYTSIPINVVLLRGDSTATDKLAIELGKDHSFESLTPYILRYGADFLLERGLIKNKREELDKMSTNDLYKLLSK